MKTDTRNRRNALALICSLTCAAFLFAATPSEAGNPFGLTDDEIKALVELDALADRMEDEEEEWSPGDASRTFEAVARLLEESSTDEESTEASTGRPTGRQFANRTAREEMDRRETQERTERERSARSRSNYIRGVELYEKGYNDDAEFFIDEALQWNPRNLDALCLRGVLEYEKGEYEKAIEYYDRGIEMEPSAAFYSNRGNALIELERFEEAIADLETALDYDENFYRAHYNLGICLIELDSPEDALPCFERALEIVPDFVRADCYRGLCHAAIGNHREAIRILERIVEEDPGNEMATVFLEIVREDAGLPNHAAPGSSSDVGGQPPITDYETPEYNDKNFKK